MVLGILNGYNYLISGSYTICRNGISKKCDVGNTKFAFYPIESKTTLLKSG